jgi:predicted HicB family RNase H-like nuclease
MARTMNRRLELVMTPELSAAVEAAAAALGLTVSTYIRRVLAEQLNVPVPIERRRRD